MSLTEIIKHIKLIIFDVDGVFTDGKFYYGNHEEMVGFHSHDGYGIRQLQKTGIEIAIISGRGSEAVKRRFAELNIQHLFLKQHNKLEAYEQLLFLLHITDDQVAYVGDDYPDLCVMEKVALPIAVPNATESVKKIAKYCTKNKGGKGAVREICDLILKAQDLYMPMLNSYLNQ